MTGPCCKGAWYHGTLRHVCAAKNGQPYQAEAMTTEILREQHRIEDRAADVWALHEGGATLVATSDTRQHFNICKDPNCQRCDYIWAHIDDETD